MAFLEVGVWFLDNVPQLDGCAYFVQEYMLVDALQVSGDLSTAPVYVSTDSFRQRSYRRKQQPVSYLLHLFDTEIIL